MRKKYFISDFSRTTGMTPGSMGMSTAALVRESATSTRGGGGVRYYKQPNNTEKENLVWVFRGNFFFTFVFVFN